MAKTHRMTKGQKVLFVIAGAMLGGFTWRIRGMGGYGAMWGLLAFGTVMTLYTFLFYGSRKKMKYELLPLGGIMAACTVYASGSVISLPGGRLISDAVFAGEEKMRYTEISQIRGAAVMMLAGFALVCLFGIFFGSLFSKKEYKIPQYLVYIGTFFGVSYGAKASVSHIIVKKLLPEVVEGFEAGLQDRLYLDMTASQAYMKHFADIKFANEIPFGYPYYETIEHISFAIAAVVLILVALIVFKDKTTAVISLVTNVVGAIAFTVPDYFVINSYKTSFLSQVNIPDALRITSNGLWEYGVGFLLGLGLALIITFIPYPLKAGRSFRSEPSIKGRMPRFVYCLIAYTFVFALVPARGLAIRTLDLFRFKGKEPGDNVELILIIVIAALAGIYFLLATKINIFDKSLPVPFRMKPNVFSGRMLIVYTSVLMFLTLVLGDDASIFVMLDTIGKNGFDARNFFIDNDYITPVLMTVSYIFYETVIITHYKRVNAATQKDYK